MGLKDLIQEKEAKGKKESLEKGITFEALSKEDAEKQRKIREEIEKAKYYEKLSFMG